MSRSGIIACVALSAVIIAGLVVLGIIITDVLQSAAQCGGDLLRNC